MDDLNTTEHSATNPTQKDGIVQERDALALKLEAEQFITTANALRGQSEAFYRKLKIPERRKENEKHLWGRQLDDIKLKPYQARYLDNVIYEGESYLKPIALSRLPDMIVKPGNDSEESKFTAKEVTKVVDSDLKERNKRKVLALAFKHMPVYFIAGIKPVWNPDLGESGDYEYKVVHPENLVVDHTSASNEVSDMQYVFEAIELSVKEWIMRFPKKEKEFYAELRSSGIFTDELNEDTQAGMNSQVKGWEVWFIDYEKVEGKLKKTPCVAWYYEDLLFDAMKHPYWDWEGEEKPVEGDEDALRSSLLGLYHEPGSDPMTQTQQIFRNHLSQPEFPYIFLGYDQWGKMPLDETSRIEQVIHLQDNLDKRGRQITEMLDRSRGKHVFSALSGLTAEDIEEMDLNDPDEDVFVKGKVNEVHAFIPGEQPSAQLIADKRELRDMIFGKMGVNGAVRGEITSDVATTNQIAREADFTRADDLTEDTINYAAERMANWAMQFMKLFYTESHFKQVLGQDGATVFAKIDRDMIEDGMEVSISASGSDKLKAEQRAMDMAKMSMIDPFQFFVDMGISDPKGRTEKLVLFQMDLAQYYQKVVMGVDNPAQGAAALNGAETAQQAMMAISQIQAGQIPPTPAAIDQSYLDTFNQWFNSGEVEQILQQFPQIQPQIIAFAEAIAQLGQMIAQPSGAPAQNGQPPAPGTPPVPAPVQQQSNTQVGNVAQGASPQNTQRMNPTPPRPGAGSMVG